MITAIPNEEDGRAMQRYVGQMPGGGLLYVHHFEVDAFGVVGATCLRGLDSVLKKDRKSSFHGVKKLLRAFDLTDKKERVLSVSLGTDSLGNEVLTVVTVLGIDPRLEAPGENIQDDN